MCTTIISAILTIAIIWVSYRCGRNDERKANESAMDLRVGKEGFSYAMCVPKGKTVKIKNSSKGSIVIIPDANSFNEFGKDDK